jgi:hypothetical protein
MSKVMGVVDDANLDSRKGFSYFEENILKYVKV